MNKTSIISTASRLFAALTLLLFLSGASMEAQVTIGKLADPHTAAILDLSQVELQNLGLLLPHVKLTGLKPFQLLSSPSPQQEIDATGMVVYNEEHVNDDVYPGIYVWDGTKWGRIDDGTLPPPPVMAPLSIDKSGADCGNGILFSIPEDYPDWNYVNNFVWTLTSPSPGDYKPVTVTSGSKNSHFFVPYDGTERNYEVSVYAEANSSTKLASSAATNSQTGNISGTNNFFIDGNDCYDIKITPYEDKDPPVTIYGVMESRTQLIPGTVSNHSYSYKVKGNGTVSSYSWSVSDPDDILLNSFVDVTGNPFNIQFRPEVLTDSWLIDHPTNERIVVLTCVVSDGSCTYIVIKEIRVGDRDCCARLTDADNNIYSAVRFGSAGCWMSENLAVTKNQKRGTTLTKGNSSTYEPRYTTPQNASFGDENAQNSDYYGTGIGKPGLLYNWAAAVGAQSSADAQSTSLYPSKTATDSANEASRSASKDEDICPVGWYLPSDAEWSLLEREIAAHPDDYTPSMTSTVTSTWSETTGWRNNTSPGHGEAMRNPKDIGTTQSPPGVSKPKESGFSGLLVGYARGGNWYSYGAFTYYWSSSSYSDTDAWRRGLGYAYAGVARSNFYKYYLRSVRCKKLD